MTRGTSVPDELRYTAEHEWARLDGDVVVVGITDFAQDQLGDVVFVQLPKPGARVEIGAEFGVIESVKSASDLFSPLSGEVIEVNTSLDEQPELVNDSPYDAGWMLRIRSESPAQLDTLMDSTAYRRHIGA